MNKNFTFGWIFYFLAYPSSVIFAQPLGASPDTSISSRELFSSLPGASNPTIFTRIGEELIEVEGDIVLRNHTMQKGQTIWDLLPNYGFESNQEIIGVVQALNPTVIDMKRINTGDHIRVPSAPGFNPNINGPKWVFEDSQPIRVLASTITANQENIELTRGLRFEDPIFESKNPYELVNDILETTNSEIANLSPEFVSLINSQSILVQDLATYLIKPPPEVMQRLLSINQKEDLFSDSSDTELRQAFSAALQTLTMASDAIDYHLPTYRGVTANTIDSTGAYKCQLAVWHAPKSSYILGQLDRDKKRLTGLSHPADGSVPISIRVFWAEWKGTVTSPYIETRIFPGASNHVIDIDVTDGASC